MKTFWTFILSLVAAVGVSAANEVTTVTEVTEAVTLDTDVDYHITSTTPFSATGSINITNTEHAVVIFDNLIPSEAKKVLGGISINGSAAVADENCQVRIYCHGSIVMPYSSGIKPLTVYSDADYAGESSNNYEVNTIYNISSSTMNNNIESFKLKRGYMVCFATSADGTGYNRIFIADSGDREIATMPATLRNKVSFIRISKWNSTDKRGYAGYPQDYNDALNTTWCYGWDAGINIYDDHEYVTHHHHEGWPSITDVGNNGTSANILGNNEPDNTGDAREQVNTVDEVLATWPQMMATGRRLGSPAMSSNLSGWLYPFIDSIDARGWRCDFICVHAYWYSDRSSWESSLRAIHNRTGRPIWITEMNYGANWTGWPGSDTSASPDNYQIELDHMGPTLDYLNSCDYIERYAAYNWVQDCRKFRNTDDATLADKNYLTPIGEYYANAETSLAYNPSLERVPSSPRVYSPTSLAYSFVPRTSLCVLTWNDQNGEFNDSIFVERKVGNGSWERIGTVERKEASGATYTYTDTARTAGSYYYRIHTISYTGSEQYSGEVLNAISGTEGSATLQYGKLTVGNTEDNYSFFASTFDEMPAVVFGGPSSRNIDVKVVEQLKSVNAVSGAYTYFVAKYYPWTLSGYQTLAKGTDFSSYVVARQGGGTIGSLNYEAGYIHDSEGKQTRVSNDTVEFKFDQSFTAAPVVFVTPRYSSSSYPVMARAFDVTADGFKIVLQRQKALDEQYAAFAGQLVSYFAIEKGKTTNDEGKIIEVGDSTMTFTSAGSLYRIQYDEDKENPMFLGQFQTLNRNVASLLRTGTSGSGAKYCGLKLTTDSTDVDNYAFSRSNPIVENVGWMCISDGTETGINDVPATTAAEGIKIIPNSTSRTVEVVAEGATTVSVYATNGMMEVRCSMIDGKTVVDLSSFAKGMHIIKTDTGKSAKVIL